MFCVDTPSVEPHTTFCHGHIKLDVCGVAAVVFHEPGVLYLLSSFRGNSATPFLWQAGVDGAQVDLPFILQLEVSVAEHAHEDAGAHVVHSGLCWAHGDLDLVAGLLVRVFRDVGYRQTTSVKHSCGRTAHTYCSYWPSNRIRDKLKCDRPLWVNLGHSKGKQIITANNTNKNLIWENRSFVKIFDRHNLIARK